MKAPTYARPIAEVTLAPSCATAFLLYHSFLSQGVVSKRGNAKAVRLEHIQLRDNVVGLRNISLAARMR